MPCTTRRALVEIKRTMKVEGEKMPAREQHTLCLLTEVRCVWRFLEMKEGYSDRGINRGMSEKMMARFCISREAIDAACRWL